MFTHISNLNIKKKQMIKYIRIKGCADITMHVKDNKLIVTGHNKPVKCTLVNNTLTIDRKADFNNFNNFNNNSISINGSNVIIHSNCIVGGNYDTVVIGGSDGLVTFPSNKKKKTRIESKTNKYNKYVWEFEHKSSSIENIITSNQSSTEILPKNMLSKNFILLSITDQSYLNLKEFDCKSVKIYATQQSSLKMTKSKFEVGVFETRNQSSLIFSTTEIKDLKVWTNDQSSITNCKAIDKLEAVSYNQSALKCLVKSSCNNPSMRQHDQSSCVVNNY
jgi:hypothetical protein